LPSFPVFMEENRKAKHDNDVRHVEYSRMKWANADEEEVRDEALPGNAVNEVAHSPRPNQRQTNEVIAAEPSVDKIREQSEKAYGGADPEYRLAQWIR